MNLQKPQSTGLKEQAGIPVHVVNSTIFISPGDISCLEGEGNYSFIHTHSGKKYLVSRTLKSLQSELSADTFLRIHKSYLINTGHIVDVLDHDRLIKMAGGKEVFISRRKCKEVSLLLETARA